VRTPLFVGAQPKSQFGRWEIGTFHSKTGRQMVRSPSAALGARMLRRYLTGCCAIGRMTGVGFAGGINRFASPLAGGALFKACKSFAGSGS